MHFLGLKKLNLLKKATNDDFKRFKSEIHYWINFLIPEMSPFVQLNDFIFVDGQR